MADTEWKNREERKGIHDKVSWVSGWISGYLTRQPQAERLCEYEKDCARSTFATCMECDKNYKNIRKAEREKVLEHVDEILKHEWANATNLDNPYRDDRHMVISRIRNTVAIYRKELREGKDGE